MATEPLLDLDTLLAPISDDNPVGEDLRADSSPTSAYYQLKDARSGARAAERQLAAEGEAGDIPAQWKVIMEVGPQVLTERTKDLEVAAWLTEALVRYYGFAGLRDGFALIKGLVQNFWEGLYPLEDEDGLETKVAPLTGLNGEGADGTLILPIRQIALTEAGDHGALAYWHYEQADAISKIADEEKRQARIESGGISIDLFNAAVSSTPPAFYGALMEDAQQATAAFAELEAALGEACGSEGPPTGSIRSVMADVIGMISYVAKDRMPLEAPAEAEGETSAEGAAAGGAPAGGGAAATAAAASAAGGGSGAISNREDAFKLLLKVAEWFRRNEPHSPISYTLEDLVRRGRLSLKDLLVELIPDERARAQFLTTAGIRPPSADGGSADSGASEGGSVVETVY